MKPFRVLAAALSALALAATAAWISVAAGGPVTWQVSIGLRTPSTLSFGLNLATATILVLTTTVGATVALYSMRYLATDGRLGRYALALTATITLLGIAVTCQDLVIMAIAWVGAGAAFRVLVAQRPEVSGLHAAMKRLRWTWLASDVAVVSGLAVVIVSTHAWTIQSVTAGLGDARTWAVTLAAALIALGGVMRSALTPFHRWLPETAVAPTPVSALLHAGLVNGLGVLVVLYWPVFRAAPVVLAGLYAVGLTSILVGTLQMWGRSDVKGKLATSTTAQMGFVALQCGLGLPAAALLHVFGHGFYKSTLFLRSGSVIDDNAKSRKLANYAQAQTSQRVFAWFVGLALSSGVAIVVIALIPWTLPATATVLLAAVAVITATVVIAAYLAGPAQLTPQRKAVASTMTLLGLAGYLVVALGFENATRMVLPETVAWSRTALAAFVVAGIATAVGLVVTDAMVQRGRFTRLYAWSVRSSLPPRFDRELVRRSIPDAGLTQVSPADRSSARAYVQEATRLAPRLWPLTDFVASNPLSGLESMRFARAVTLSERLTGRHGFRPIAEFRALYDADVITADALSAVLDRRVGHDIGTLHLPSTTVSGHELRQALVLGEVLQSPDDSEVAAVAAKLNEVPDTWFLATEIVHSPLHNYDAAHGTRFVDSVDHEVNVWLLAATDMGEARWQSATSQSLWQEWRSAYSVGAERSLGLTGLALWCQSLSLRADEALAQVLDFLGIATDERESVIEAIVARKTGWAGRLATSEVAVSILELVTLTLVLETAVLSALIGGDVAIAVRDLAAQQRERDLIANRHHIARRAVATLNVLGATSEFLAAADEAGVNTLVDALSTLSSNACLEIWQSAYEESTRRELLADLNASPISDAPETVAQLVFCIDVRSEGFRRHLEHIGSYETFGFAGFFGVPMSFQGFRSALQTDQCPVLITPRNTVRERGHGSAKALAADALDRAQKATTRTAMYQAQSRAVAGFATAEAAGPILALQSIGRTVAPSAFRRRPSQSPASSTNSLRTTLDVAGPDVRSGRDASVFGFTITERVYLAEAALRAMGLTKNFASTVWLVGHRATTTNNPYAAGYQCGACGGHTGAANARALATILNDRRVRQELLRRNILVPQTTWFVPAEHDTTTDVVDVLDSHVVPESHRGAVAAVAADLATAGDRNRSERMRELQPGANDRRARAGVHKRAADWSELIPEWGLAGNEAIVIGPRSLTKNAHLGRRAFLHSYDYRQDLDGAALEVILTAPVIVAQWINAQYYFAATDPHGYGAGSKVVHNVAGRHGVVTGPRGDLRAGLPLQSVFAHDSTRMHDPQRLFVVVHAPRVTVDAILARHPELVTLIENHWMSLAVIDTDGVTWRCEGPALWSRDNDTSRRDVTSPAPLAAENESTSSVSAQTSSQLQEW